MDPLEELYRDITGYCRPTGRNLHENGQGARSARVMTPLVYIAGPITKGVTSHHAHVAMQAWKRLWDAGVYAICPHWSLQQDMATPLSHAEWMRYDAALIPYCTALWRLPGESEGADQEVKMALELGIPVLSSYEQVIELIKRQETPA